LKVNRLLAGTLAIVLIAGLVTPAFAGTEPDICDRSSLGYMSDSDILYCLYGIGEPPTITSNNVISGSSSIAETTNSIPGAVLLGTTATENIGAVHDHLTGIGTAITPNPLEIQPPELTPTVGPFEESPEFADMVDVYDIECSEDGLKCFYGTTILDRGPVTGFDFLSGDACTMASAFCLYFSVMDDSIYTLTPFTLVKAGDVITGINPQTPRTLNIPLGITQLPVFDTIDSVIGGFPTFSCGQPACSTGSSWYDGFEYADGVLYAAFNQVTQGATDGLLPFRSTLVEIPTGGVGDITPIPIGNAFSSSTRGYAFDTTDGTMYAVGGGGNFYTVNLATGDRTAITNSADFGGALQFGPDDRLYSDDSFAFPNGLAVIEPTDGMVTSLPNPTGFDTHTRGLTLVSKSLTPSVPVGGELIPIETTSLLLAGAQSFSWMIPLVLSVLGIGLFVVSRKSENS